MHGQRCLDTTSLDCRFQCEQGAFREDHVDGFDGCIDRCMWEAGREGFCRRGRRRHRWIALRGRGSPGSEQQRELIRGKCRGADLQWRHGAVRGSRRLRDFAVERVLQNLRLSAQPVGEQAQIVEHGACATTGCPDTFDFHSPVRTATISRRRRWAIAAPAPSRRIRVAS